MHIYKQTTNIFKTAILAVLLLFGCTRYEKYDTPEIISIGERRVDDKPDYLLYSPDWSPDGNRLIVSTDSNYLHIIDLVGNSTQILSKVSPTAYNQAWSPQGNEILYTDDNGPTIWKLSLSDNKVKPEEFSNGVIANWSPDGKKIIVGKISDPEDQYVKLVEVSIIDLETKVENIIYSVEEIIPGIVEMEWSPNGNLIAFRITFYLSEELNSERRSSKLVIIDINNNQILEIQEDNGLGRINWSQDSEKILYLIDANFEGSVFRIRDNQGSCKEIFSELSLVVSPKLSDNESMLAFIGRGGGLYVIETELALGDSFWEKGTRCNDN